MDAKLNAHIIKFDQSVLINNFNLLVIIYRIATLQVVSYIIFAFDCSQFYTHQFIIMNILQTLQQQVQPYKSSKYVQSAEVIQYINSKLSNKFFKILLVINF
uniref:Transmembrane protein n=1 Tax=Spironucleus salmonicida TaxID=348837 RepID=V6LU89_9EUKA|eukprot:EST47823.1 Hypothetical protein SS50377_fx045 [Spironucleus salmonicida]